MGERHDPETHLIPLILDVASGKRPNVKIFGTDYETHDGTCIHITDLADSHILALEYLRGGGSSDSFNLGNGNGFSVREVIRMAEQITGTAIECVETKRRAGNPPVLIGSSSKVRNILGWRPRCDDLAKIIETAWHWHKKQSLL